MKQQLKYLFVAMAGIGLSGCVSFSDVDDVLTLRRMDPPQGGTAFTRALADAYKAAATWESEPPIGMWDDAAWYARRGLQAANGEVVIPVDPTNLEGWHWQVPPPNRLTLLVDARSQLMGAFNMGARERVPVPAARAQVAYDCWVEEESELDTTSKCGADFRALLSTLIIAPVAAPAPLPAPAPAAQPVAQRAYQIFFDWDQSVITASAAETIRQAAENARRGNVTRIMVTGHTDASGSTGYNQALSERRAQAVRAELVRDGLPIGQIQTSGVGKSGQLVPTQDGVREPQNRRAEIVLQQ